MYQMHRLAGEGHLPGTVEDEHQSTESGPQSSNSSTLLVQLSRLEYQQSEQRLMLAVLKDAVGCIERYHHTHTSCGRREYQEALQWVLAHDQHWPFSFENLCVALDFDPTQIRSVLLTPTDSVVHTRRK